MTSRFEAQDRFAAPGRTGPDRPAAAAWWSVGLIGAAAAAAIAPTSADWVERIYARHVYAALQPVVTRASNLVGVALLDLLAAAAALALVVWWWRTLRRAGPGRRRAAAARLILHTAAAGAAVYLVFLGMWGLHYRRLPLTVTLDYDPARVAPAPLRALAAAAIRRLNALHGPAAAAPWPAFEALPARLGPGFAQVQRQLGARRPALPGRPKATLLNGYFRRAGITGLMSPFSLEVLVLQDVLPYERPFLLAHEWAHLAGHADEAEASFVGVLICLAGDAQSRYSAWLRIAPQAIGGLPAAARARAWAGLDAGPRRHLTAISARAAEASPVVRRNARRIYDRYLRANRVDAGIASYGLVIDLLLGTGGAPAWRDPAAPAAGAAVPVRAAPSSPAAAGGAVPAPGRTPPDPARR